LGINIIAMNLTPDWVIMGIERMGILAIRQIVTGTLNLIGVILIVDRPEDAPYAIAILVSAGVINALWMLSYYFKNFPGYKLNIDLQLLKSALKSGLPILFYSLMVLVISMSGIIFIGHFIDEDATGKYYAAHKLHQLLAYQRMLHGTL